MAERYQISPFFRGGWSRREPEPGFVGEVVGRDPTVGSDDVGKLFCLYHASEPKPKEEIVRAVVDGAGVEAEAARSAFDWLVEHGFLVPEGAYDDAIDQWLENGWLFALYFHEYVAETYSERDTPPRTVEGDGTCPFGPARDEWSDDEFRQLPSPPPFPGRPLDEILCERATCRDFSGDPVSVEELSAILQYGLLGDADAGSPLTPRSTYFRVYPFVSRVETLSAGVYEYVPSEHGVVPLDRSYDSEEIDRLLTRLIVGQPYAEQAGVSLVVTVDFPTICEDVYRARRLPAAYVLLSQMAQMALLTATAFGIDTFQTAAFEDSHVGSVLRTRPLEEGPGYVLTFGHGA